MRIAFSLVLFMSGLFSAISLEAQNPDFGNDHSPVGVITGRPFSAVKFSRHIHNGPDSHPVITDEQWRVMVARDGDGRIFMTEAESQPNEACDLPNMGGGTVCDGWIVILFDPKEALLWHWGVGAKDEGTQYVEWILNSDQVAEDIRAISLPPTQPSHESEPGVSIEELGERSVEGVPARGVRKTTSRKDDEGTLRVAIHEVWTSIDMGLVLKVIDGDPEGDETVSGLDHISFAPASALFKLPVERILRRHQYAFFDGDRDDLENWLVR